MKKPAHILAFSYLGICILLSLFAYVFISDKSMDANRHVPELALIDPLKKVCIQCELLQQKEQSYISRMVFGDQNAYKCNQLTSPDKSTEKQCFTLWFGTDKFGRDVFSRTVLGIRYTLMISLTAVLISIMIGLILGCLAGYFGGRIDHIISIGINVFWSLPTILLAFAIILAFGRNYFSIFIAIGLTMWGDIARLVRAQIMQYKEMLFVQVLTVLGFPHWKILFKEILPNIMGPVYVNAAGNFALAVLLESGLSFLGFGLQPPKPTLGNILQEQYVYAISGKPFLALIPSIVVVLLILSFQVLTSYLRDRGDIKAL